jgi:hypothetical protein
MKQYTMRGLALEKGKRTFRNLGLEFEGARAFVIWDSVTCGDYEFKTRLEIDPKRLRKTQSAGWDFFYHGSLELPCPQDN